MTTSSFRSGNASDDYQEESGILDAQTAEDRLIDAFDNLLAKSAKTRLMAFEVIRKILSESYMIDFIYNRKMTIFDTISRCMKKSKGQDLGYVASLLSIICTTLGSEPETDPLISELISQLLILLADQTIVPEVRVKFAKTIAICTFIIGIDGYLEEVMARLYAIFSGSFTKGDGLMPNPSKQIAALHAASLQSWTLLLTAVNNSSNNVALEIVEEYMDKIKELLDSPHLDVKTSAGESLAVMHEIIKLHNDDITGDDFDDLCDKLREIMSDAQKSKGKKDLRQQRSNFREILALFEEGELPCQTIKFGRERLVLESWSKCRQYDAFCDIFSTGLNHHLAENEALRDIFGLGEVIIHMDIPRQKRSENLHELSMADKVRTKNLRKLRDKRSVVFD